MHNETALIGNLEQIANHLERIADNTACLGDMPTAVDVIGLNKTLDRIAAALEAVRAVPECAANPETLSALETRLKTLDEKADAVLDVLGVIAGAVAPNAAFALRQFSDGNGRFLPTDAPADTPTTDA